MRTLTIRKAYKASCELKERVAPAKSAIAISSKYEVFDALGELPNVIENLHQTQKQELDRNYTAIKLVCSLRQRIQEANSKPLPYADNLTISDLVAKQATLKSLVAFFPEDKDTNVTSTIDLELQAKRHKNILEDTSNSYRTSTNANLTVTGISQEIKDYISAERLALRVELESVTGKLAYANITETIELSDEDVEILNSFRIPV